MAPEREASSASSRIVRLLIEKVEQAGHDGLMFAHRHGFDSGRRASGDRGGEPAGVGGSPVRVFDWFCTDVVHQNRVGLQLRINYSASRGLQVESTMMAQHTANHGRGLVFGGGAYTGQWSCCSSGSSGSGQHYADAGGGPAGDQRMVKTYHKDSWDRTHDGGHDITVRDEAERVGRKRRSRFQALHIDCLNVLHTVFFSSVITQSLRLL